MTARTFKDGRRSKYREVVPTKMMRVIDALVENPDFLRSVDEIGLLESRVIDLLEQIKEGHVDAFAARALVDDAFAAIQEQDGKKLSDSLHKLREALSTAVDEPELWKEVRTTLAERRKTVDIDRRVIESQKQTLTPEELMWLALQISQVMMSFKEHVPEELFKEQVLYLEEILMGRKQTRQDQQIIDVTNVELLGDR